MMAGKNQAALAVCAQTKVLSDHYAVFCNRKCKSVVGKNTHQVINYRSFKNFNESTFLDDLK